jgi:hypothetical protein
MQQHAPMFHPQLRPVTIDRPAFSAKNWISKIWHKRPLDNEQGKTPD